MREIRTSGLMSGDGKRGGAVAPVLAPILDSTGILRSTSARTPTLQPGVPSGPPSGSGRSTDSLHLIAHGDIHRLRRVAGPIAACLIAQLSGGRSRTRRSVRRYLEIRHQEEPPGVHRKRLLRELVLL